MATGLTIGSLIYDIVNDSASKSKDDNCECNYYHYTDEAGYSGIVNSNYTIRRNSSGLVYVTKYAMNSTQASNNLFMGGYGVYQGKGQYVIQFTMDCNTPLSPGTQPNELIHFGSLRLGRQINKIVYSGVNPF